MRDSIIFICPHCNKKFFDLTRNLHTFREEYCTTISGVNKIFYCKHGFIAKTIGELISKCKPCRIEYISEKL